VCARVGSASAADAAGGSKPPAELCPGGECLDMALLHGLNARIAALPAERTARGVVLVLHQMGSHGPAYFKRSPEAQKAFLPECKTNVLQNCPREELVNAYDNSIVYADFLLSSSIAWLKQQSAYASALLYVSDHGESLGENNVYLHGLPYAFAPKAQKHVPWITWLSPEMEGANRLSVACLNTRRDAALSHDNLSHTLMGLLRVRTTVYAASKDAFAPCRSE
jgi:lipid A ethanolaminephosphotransferase